MILGGLNIELSFLGLSRIRGGDPIIKVYNDGLYVVYPAYAGVILNNLRGSNNAFSLSRIRGGDPQS